VSVDIFNEFIYTRLKTPKKKDAHLTQNIQQFCLANNAIFAEFLKRLVFTLLFEDHKNIWIYQKCTFSSIVMCES